MFLPFIIGFSALFAVVTERALNHEVKAQESAKIITKVIYIKKPEAKKPLKKKVHSVTKCKC